MSDIEIDFEKLGEAINARIRIATQAMKEANDLAKAAGIPGLVNYEYLSYSTEESIKVSQLNEHVDIYPLFNELDAAGWSTSSISC